MKNKDILNLLGLFALTILIIIPLLIPFNIEKPPTETRPAAESCNSIKLKTIPSPLRANKSGTLIIETDPPTWKGLFSVSTSSGSVMDTTGKTNPYIETNEKILSFSGGDANSTITVQDINAKNCVATITIEESELLQCESINIETYPSPITENESAEITINTTPPQWEGAFLIKADSGKLTLSSADPAAIGINTNILVTSIKKIIYNGGKSDETIEIKALNTGNENCEITLTIQEYPHNEYN